MKLELALFSSFVLFGSLHTQAQVHYPPERVSTPSGDFDGGRCTKSAVGDFTGDCVADVVVLSEANAVLTHAPSLYGGTLTLAGNVSDLERWPANGDDRDSVLLASTTQGLRIARWEGGATPEGVVTLTAVSGLGDLAARHVTVLDLDGDGDLEIATTALNARDVSVFGFDGAAFGDTPLLFSAAGEIADIAALQWSPENEGQELAVLSSAGLEVLSDAGGELATRFEHLRPCTYPLLSVIRELPSRERAAWIADGVLPNERVLIVSDVRGSEPDLSFGTFIPVVGMSALSLAPNAPPALMVSHEHNHTLGMLIANPGATPPTTCTYSSAAGALAYIALVNDTPLDPFPTNGAVPAIADFDNDGDEDIWMPIVSRAEGVLLPSVAIAACDRRPIVYDAERVSDIGAGVTTFWLSFTSADFEPAPSVDTLEYRLWRVNETGSALGIEASGALAAPGGECVLEHTLAVQLDVEERFNERFVLQARLRGENYVGPFGSWSISGNVNQFAFDLMHNRACADAGNFYSFATSQRQGVKLAASAPATAAENIGGVIPRPRPPSGEPTPTGP